MPENVYELISLGARYWFALLGVLIVWRSFSWLRKDRRAKHKRLKQLPDAGMIGEMVVLRGSDELPEGCAIPVPREGTLGFLRTCDMVVPVEGVAPHHIDFAFQDGRGLLLFPWHGCECTMDGETLTARSKTKHYPMHHGSRLEVGEALLRLRLFAGLETQRRGTLMADLPEEEEVFQPEEDFADWQDAPYVYHQVPASWADGTGRYAPVQPEQGGYYLPQNPYPYPSQPCAPQQPYGQSMNVPQLWAGPDWRGKGWSTGAPQPPYSGTEETWQPPVNAPGYAQPWQEEAWEAQESPAPEEAEDAFEPLHARQRRSRFGRRRSHEEN